MSLRSTTLRFALLVFVLQVAAAVALLVVVGLTVRGEIRAAAALEANTLRDDLLATWDEGGRAGLVEAVRARTRELITPGTVLLVTDAAGRPLAGNLADWPASIAAPARLTPVTLFRIGHVEPERMWVRADRLRDGTRLLTGGVTEGAARALHSFADAAVLSAFLAVLFAAIAAWLAARTIVTRLDRTIAVLAGARAGDLSRRVAPDPSGDAFAALGDEVNATLARLDGLVGELKLATDGLAHDLKSPLTRLRAGLERAGGRDEDTARALAECDRILQIIETALRISRAEAGIGREVFLPTSLHDQLCDLAEIYGPVAEDQGRSVAVHAPVDAVLPVHRELLAQALGNLIDNALKYGAGPILLSLDPRAEGAEIAVSDQGPGIAPERRDQALARFGRLDDARGTPGAGLGLSLVAAVARLHGGELRLRDAMPGLAVAFWLPSAPG